MVQCGVPAVIKSITTGIPQLSDPSPRYSCNIHTHTCGKPADSVGLSPSPSQCTPLLTTGIIYTLHWLSKASIQFLHLPHSNDYNIQFSSVKQHHYNNQIKTFHSTFWKIHLDDITDQWGNNILVHDGTQRPIGLHPSTRSDVLPCASLSLEIFDSLAKILHSFWVPDRR